MSVLDAHQIVDLIKKKELVISPILSKEQVRSVSVDLRLGNVALIVRARGLSHVDPKQYFLTESTENEDRHSHEQGRRQKLERYEIMFQEPLLLHPGTLVLVPTLEWVKLPFNLKGVVTARSSWAREGLNIATANFINPGYAGIITLELSNLGQIPIAIYPGMRIAQIAFHQVLIDDKNLPEKAPLKSVSQFSMSFEPRAGEITKDDDAFIDPP